MYIKPQFFVTSMCRPFDMWCWSAPPPVTTPLSKVSAFSIEKV